MCGKCTLQDNRENTALRRGQIQLEKFNTINVPRLKVCLADQENFMLFMFFLISDSERNIQSLRIDLGLRDQPQSLNIICKHCWLLNVGEPGAFTVLKTL